MWAALATSADGTKLIAASWDGSIYTSTNSGATWKWNWVPNGPWFAVASSTDGHNLIAAMPALEQTGPEVGIYASTNGGANWIQTAAPKLRWTAVASSSDGTRIVAVAREGGIYTSADSGSNWTPTGAPGALWLSVASSADGTRLVAAGGGSIYTSTNAGASWISNSVSRAGWYSVASSTDGSKLVAAAHTSGSSSGPICVWLAPAILNISISGTDAVLAWQALSSAAGFVLQQSSDLTTTDWVTVSALVVVTNGQNRVILSRREANMLYRLGRQ